MKLTDVMKSHGWEPYETDKDYNKLKVYQKDDLFFGVQKIGNVFRLDIQQCINLGGMMFPSQKVVDSEMIPREALEDTINQILTQLNQQYQGAF